MSKERINVFSGVKIGILSVGELVTDIKNHPLYYDTRASYLTHWRVRECLCDCGVVKLYSENALSSGHIQSCGCLRMRMRQESWERKQAKALKKEKRKDLKHRISMLTDKISLLQLAPTHLRNHLKIDQLAKEKRSLQASLAYLSRD